LKERTPHRHISKLVEITLIGFGVFVLAVFFLMTALHYYTTTSSGSGPDGPSSPAVHRGAGIFASSNVVLKTRPRLRLHTAPQTTTQPKVS